MDINTLCVHGGNKDHSNGAVSMPIYQSATFSHLGVGKSTGYDYSRLANPTRTELETIITKLEYGYDAMAFSTGMAAIVAVMDLFSPGDHIIASDDLYGGSYRFFNNISNKNGLRFDFVDTSNVDNVKKHISQDTKAIFVETPSNPMMHVSDIGLLSELGKENNILVIVDNTFLTPYFMNPIHLGANIVIHSGTKYLGGHNDTLAGFVIVDSEELSEKLRFIYKTVGACLSPFDSWLLIRGIKTLAIRMEKQQANAKVIAEWLTKHPKIKNVNYIGLETHPGFDISKKQGRGFGAMISFETDLEETAVKLLENVQIILYAESLGGVETLITYPMLQTHADVPQEEREKLGINEKFLRLSVGIEDYEDLIYDLETALK